MSASGQSAPDGGTARADQSCQLPRIPDQELLRRIGRGSYGEARLAR